MKEQLTVFYTDDDLDDLKMFKEIIASLDESYNLVTQKNGDELIAALYEPDLNPYIIFLDINMPGLNGFDLLKIVRQSGRHKQLPVVMFSTSAAGSLIEKSRMLGATFYLAKTGVYEQFRNSIQHVLSINWNNFIPTEQNFVYYLQHEIINE